MHSYKASIVQLVGRDTFVDDSGNRVSMNRTKAAGAYPLPLVEVWASLLSRTLQPCHVEEELETIVERFNSGILQASKRGNSPQFDILDRLCRHKFPNSKSTLCLGKTQRQSKHRKENGKRKRQEPSQYSLVEAVEFETSVVASRCLPTSDLEPRRSSRWLWVGINMLWESWNCGPFVTIDLLTLHQQMQQ